MATDLFRYNRLRTTDTRAKELRRVAEKLITLAKDGSLHKRRQAGAYIRDNDVLKKLFTEIAEKFKDRPGGYTRIIKLGFRKGDNSPISLIELVEEDFKPKKKKKKKAPAKVVKPRVPKETAKSSKKESAEELGLIEEEPKAAADTAETEVKEAQVEETPEAKVGEAAQEAQDTPAAEAQDDASEATAVETSTESEAQSAEDTSTKETTGEPEAKAEDAEDTSDETDKNEG